MNITRPRLARLLHEAFYSGACYGATSDRSIGDMQDRAAKFAADRVRSFGPQLRQEYLRAKIKQRIAKANAGQPPDRQS